MSLRKEPGKKPHAPAPAAPKKNGAAQHDDAGEEFPLFPVMRDDGSVDDARMPKLSKEEILRLYRLMVTNRILDERLTTLQRQGRIGFHIGSIGEEAAITGSSSVLAPEDWLLPRYREPGAADLLRMSPPTVRPNSVRHASD